MTIRIAIAGKGGTGKTTLAALLIRYLQVEHPRETMLVVDADANANLNEALGLAVQETIATILETTKKPGGVPVGMTKDVFIEYNLSRSLVETKHFDLLVMGNPQGPGCYCYPNDLLRRFLEKLSVNYDYLIMDNEAGMEHISRRVLPQADLLLITSDATARGVRTAGRIREIAESLDLKVGRMGLVISRSREGEVEQLSGEIARTGLELWGEIPYEPEIVNYDIAGKALLELPTGTAAVQAADKLFAALAI